jgi:hypothetical protein
MHGQDPIPRMKVSARLAINHAEEFIVFSGHQRSHGGPTQLRRGQTAWAVRMAAVSGDLVEAGRDESRRGSRLGRV